MIDSAGLVGIGMSPSEELDVAGDIRASESFYADEGNAGAPAYSFDGDADTGIFGSGVGDLAISTNGLQRLVVDSSGNVGIGEPSPGQALDVVGNGEFSGYVLGESFRIDADTGLYDQGAGLSLNVGGAPALTILSSGEVGIGTTNPNMELEVSGAIRIGDTANGCGAGTSGSIKYTSAGDALEYCSSDGNWYAIGASGGGGGGIGSPRISSLQEASAINTIDNANYTQTWNWDTLTTGNGLRLGSTSVTSGNVLSVVANNTSSDGSAIHARANGSSGSSAILAEATGSTSYGLEVTHANTVGAGVYSLSTAGTAGDFVSSAVAGVGIYGTANGGGMSMGGRFTSQSTSGGYGAYVNAAGATGTNYGIYAQANSADAYAGYFMNTANGWGIYTEDDFGLAANSYINWGTIGSTTKGAGGYGIRDNNGVIEMKNSGGIWSPISNSGSVGGAPGADTQVVYNSGGTLGADANFTWDRTTARMGLGVASPTGRLQTGDTLYDTAVCPAGYVAGDFDGEGDVQDCVSVGLVVLPDGNVGVGTTTPNLMSAARELSVSTGMASGAVGINLQGNVTDGSAVGAIGAWNNSDLVSMIQFPRTGTAGSIQFGVSDGASMDLNAMILQSDGNIVLGDLAADAGLRLDVNGAVGATEYCDEDGLNCIDIADVSGAGGADTEVQFNSGGKLAGSPGFTWTEGSSALNVTGRVNITDRVNIAGQVGSAPQLMRLGDLTDVDTTGAVDGNAIIFDGTNWVVGTVGSGSIGAAGSDRQVQFNSNGNLAADAHFVYTSAGDFIVGSSQMDDAAGADDDSRMFFNKAKSAFRVGAPILMTWDDAYVGNGSVATGVGTLASGDMSVALGSFTQATGVSSFAMGASAIASGETSFALGNQAEASGEDSVAIGEDTDAIGNGSFAAIDRAYASGTNAIAIGQQTLATGTNSVALGTRAMAGNGTAGAAGNYSMALGLGLAANDWPKVTGDSSFGIFMGNQDYLDISANNQMSLLGGKMVIDPRVPATNLTADTTFEVEGTIKISYSNEACDASREGSIRYMSNTDTFEVCAATASGWEEIGGNIEQVAGDPPVSNFVENLDDLGDVVLAGSANGECLVYNGTNWINSTCTSSAPNAAGADRQIQFNSGNSFAADANFVYTSAGSLIIGSSEMDDDSGTTDDNARMFFDKDNAAFRAGFVGDDVFWDSANRGWASVAMGQDTTASGQRSVAMGNFTQATGDQAFAVGENSIASGGSSMAFGADTEASGFAATALGSTSRAVGNRSLASGSASFAGGENSTALGHQTKAVGYASTAMGTFSMATGEASTTMGEGTIATGRYGIAMGLAAVAGDGLFVGSDPEQGSQNPLVGEGTMAIGLVTADNANNFLTVFPKVTGNESLGIFMNAQEAVELADSNTMGLFGGKMVIDPRVPASNLSADTAFEVEGTIKIAYSGEACDADREGSIRYMSNTDTFEMCAVAANDWEAIGGSVTPGGVDTNVQFNSNGTLDGSSNFTWNEGTTTLDVNGVVSISDRLVLGGTAGNAPTYIALADLSDVDVSGVANGECLAYDGAQWTAAACGGGGSFVSLSDTPADYTGAAGMFVKVNAGATGLEFTNTLINSVSGAPAPTGMVLGDLDNVSVASPTNGDVLTYDGTNWVSAAGGGGGATPGGADTYVQFNSNGALGGTADFTWDQGNTILSISGVVSVGEKIAMGGVAGNLPTYMGLNGLSDVDTTGVANGDALVYDGSEWVPGSAGATPGGANTHVQFNSNGELHGVAGFTWNNATTTLGVTGKINVSDRINITGQAGNAPNEMTIANLGDVALASPANGECLVYDGTNWENAACGGGGGGAISGLTAATATNTINNLNFAQTWNWNTLTTETALAMASTSMTSGTMLSVSSTNGTATGTNIYSSINTTGAAKAIYGRSWGTSGTASGVYGEAASAAGYGVYGVNSAAGSGVYGTSTAASGYGVTGVANGAGGVGVRGTTSSTSGVGVFGDNTAVSGTTSGVYGSAASASGFGVYGTNAASAGIGVGGVANAGAGIGVLGITSSTTAGATGVRGNSTGTSGAVYGVHGTSSSTAGAGVLGANSATSGSTAGVWGTAASASGFGMYGNNTASGGTGIGGVANTGAGVAVWGSTTSTTAAATGVRGTASGASGATYGVYGSSSSATGYGGYFTNLSTGVALHAQGDITYTGVLTDTSDIRLKTDIQQLDAQDVLARLDQIDTYSFRMRDDVSGQLELGVMAQEVEKVFPELVRTASDEMGTKSVNYTGFVAPLIEATKTLKAENDNLKAELASLKTEQVAMLSSIDDLRADMNGMKAHTGYGIGKAQMGVGLIAGMILMGGMGGIIHLVSRRRRKIS
ncbi:tail fiber domain-containing protein [Micavibrio aeruginosavorus]|uniref:Hep_Hag family protein n=1 Tax=Micavibrio aeruginosavorus (strain ARL-13) TaxID=856793 RepID=G2KQN0_MICAA|nr:tail fiber domain-containing protein [Micavibrio aeruginosavorus]AEP09958.1 hep_Hag family protein [Micavibrio aeruginosavorus ARL-13]